MTRIITMLFPFYGRTMLSRTGGTLKTRIHGYFVLLLLFVLMTGCASICALQPGSAPTFKGPYLIFEGSNTEMTVLWVDKFETNILSWGTDKNNLTGKASVPEYGVKYGEENGHQHKYKITGLTPGTKYYYQVEGYDSGSGSFVTAPKADATAVKLLAYGDTRSFPESHEKVAAGMRQAYKKDPAFQTIVLHSGDWVSSDSESSWTSQWFDPKYQEIRKLQAEVPIAGARGNHERNGKYFKKYYPYAADFYWSFDYGPAHIVILDNNRGANYDPDSGQYKWLKNELDTTRKPWKIVVMHEPAWGASKWCLVLKSDRRFY